ncbi:MAG: flippase-like domain-containing protein [Kiloniellaceae bacterium]
MKRFIALLIGLALLGAVAAYADLGAVWEALGRLGPAGALAIVAIYLVSFVVDTASWQLMLPSTRRTAGWLYRLTKIRLVGEAFNVVIPAGTLGGEPVKAILLKRAHGLGYHEGAASLIIAKTVNLLALIAFCAVGLVLLWRTPALAGGFGVVSGAGLGLLARGVVGFYAVQRRRVSSRLARWLSRHSLGSGLVRFLEEIEEVDDRLVAFYTGRPGAFAAALALAFSNWLITTAELYLIMWLLGYPVSWGEAWMIETAAQLVRAGAFLIPGGLGASEAVMVLILDALAGRPALGLALALARRGREALWIAWGMWLAWLYALSPAEVSSLTLAPAPATRKRPAAPDSATGEP